MIIAPRANVEVFMDASNYHLNDELPRPKERAMYFQNHMERVVFRT